MQRLASPPDLLEDDVEAALLLQWLVLINDHDFDAVGGSVIDQLLANVLPALLLLEGHAHNEGPPPIWVSGSHLSEADTTPLATLRTDQGVPIKIDMHMHINVHPI